MYDINDLKFVSKPRSVMGDYIGLNFIADFGKDIPYNEVWIREDKWEDPEERKRLIVHETSEIFMMMNYGLPYKKAHDLANELERSYVHYNKAVTDDIDVINEQLSELKNKLNNTTDENMRAKYQQDINALTIKRDRLMSDDKTHEFIFETVQNAVRRVIALFVQSDGILKILLSVPAADDEYLDDRVDTIESVMKALIHELENDTQTFKRFINKYAGAISDEILELLEHFVDTFSTGVNDLEAVIGNDTVHGLKRLKLYRDVLDELAKLITAPLY